jgi:hypothetical protein
MKKAFAVMIALMLMLSIAPAMAGDEFVGKASDTFYALSKMATEEQGALTPLPDDQLAAITGGVIRLDFEGEISPGERGGPGPNVAGVVRVEVICTVGNFVISCD